jgi:hypothetical protein
MANDENEHQSSVEPIPKLFWSDLTESKFEKCMLCEDDLLSSGKPYFIEKAFKTYVGHDGKSTLFEYAMCLQCKTEMEQRISEKSKAALQQHFGKRMDPNERREKFAEVDDIHAQLEHCVLDGQPPSAGGEYQIIGLCIGGWMIRDEFPYMIRGESVDELVELISNETLDELRGFMDENFSGPPEFREILDEVGPRVLI